MNDLANPNLRPEQAHLLLYLSGELPPRDASALERRLAAEPALRDELDALRQVHVELNRAFAAADAAEPIDARVRSAERLAARVVAQWQVDRATARRTAAAAAPRRAARNVPVWLYPLSAAALVMVGLGVWSLSVNDPAVTSLDDGIAGVDHAPPVGQGAAADLLPEWMYEGIASHGDGDELAVSTVPGVDGISSMESGLAELQLLRDSLQ
jgi:hypothetical protein